ncbi:acyclic terpene utilization AtuA family protein [Symbiopectobacterium purcellii]|uniref:acyclic terpene utilization AtuA family protein n=1 Tax=Symbiopectobacterium purcellii TaxID=2871826 RepID=UPI003F8346AD
MYAVLPTCLEKGIKIITNMGSANPTAAGQRVLEIAKELGATQLKIAVVTGDDVRDVLIQQDARLDEIGQPVSTCGKEILCANGPFPVETQQNGRALCRL